MMSNIMTIYRVSKPISVLLAVLERLSDRARSNTSAQRSGRTKVTGRVAKAFCRYWLLPLNCTSHH